MSISNELSTPKNEPNAARRRWYQFSLRTLLVLTALSSVPLAWYGYHYQSFKRQGEIIAILRVANCQVSYDTPGVEATWFYNFEDEPKPHNSELMRWLYGNLAIAPVTAIRNDSPLPHRLKNSQLELCSHFPELRMIKLDGKEFDDETLKQLSINATSIRCLNLKGGKFTAEGLGQLKTLNRLKWLHFGGRGDVLAHVDLIPNLERIEHESTRIMSDDLKPLSRCSKLLNLYIYGDVRIGNDGLQYLANQTNLTYLEIRGSQVDDHGLYHLRNLHQLDVLELENCLIDGSGFEVLREWPKLTWLKLSGTQINNYGIKKLVEHVSPALEYIFLNDTEITQDALDDLVHLKSLKGLHMNGIPISDSNLAKFAAFKNLRALSIMQPSEEMVKKLKEQLPPHCYLNCD